MLELLNSRHRTIKFTVEKEAEGIIYPSLTWWFRDGKIINWNLVYLENQPSWTRYITSDSNHFGAQQKATFHSTAHRLYSISMEKDDFVEERNRIHKAAELNGYEKEFVHIIWRKDDRKKHSSNSTTMWPEKVNVIKISLPFYPKLTNQIQRVLNQHGQEQQHDALSNLNDKSPSRC